MTQPDLFTDYGARLRDAGLASAASRDPSWNERAYAAIVAIARRQSELHTDDLRYFSARDPAPGRYHMGAVWMRAIKAGIIEDTGRSRRAADPKKHAKKMSVYRSLIFRGWE